MQIHNLIQGSPEWQQFRLDHDGASEAAAMLGLSPKVKRNELLHMKHTGMPKEFSDWVQENILDYGHEVEALARPIIEELIGEDLYPVTCSDGKLSASCDGLTVSEEIAMEHKQWNEALAASVTAGILPEEHIPQCQQVLMVTGAQKLIFVVSDGTREKMVYMWVEPDPVWFDRIRAGWAQWLKDLTEYKPRELAEKPQAEAILQLPALAIQIRGEVTLSNLPKFKEAADRFIANIKTDLQTDQDFSDAEATVKFCEESEKKLALAKESALSQTASIDELLRTIDHIKDQLRDKRLMLDKLVTKEKAARKEKILVDGKARFAEHVAALEAEIKPIKLVYAQPDFVGAAKNKRTLASLHDAVDSELANGKIATDAMAKDIRTKLAWCKQNAEGYGFLFSDLQQIVQKPMDDFQMVVNARVKAHKDAEEEKLQADRERIRKEETDRLERTQKEEDALIASIWSNARRIEFDSVPYIQKAIGHFESGVKDFEGDSRPRVVAAIAEARAEMSAKLVVAQQKQEAEAKLQAEQAAEAAHQQAERDLIAEQERVNAEAKLKTEQEAASKQTAAPVVKTVLNPAAAWPPISNTNARQADLLTKQPAVDNRPPITTGALCALAGDGCSITAAFIQSLGVNPADRPKEAKSGTYWAASDVPVIFAALARHFEQLATTESALAA
jgi:predicted phage-related endonuclease